MNTWAFFNYWEARVWAVPSPKVYAYGWSQMYKKD